MRPDYKLFRDAVVNLHRLMPAQLQGSQDDLDTLRAALNHKAVAEYELGLTRLHNLANSLQGVLGGMSRDRKEDIRSAWHPSARVFATLIEMGYIRSGIPPPSRKSVSSPLVLAIQDLLRLTGVKGADGDAIRQVLGKKPSQKSSQANRV